MPGSSSLSAGWFSSPSCNSQDGTPSLVGGGILPWRPGFAGWHNKGKGHSVSICPSFSLFPPSCSNFSNYRSRFSMPGDTESLWYRCVPGLQGAQGQDRQDCLPSQLLQFLPWKKGSGDAPALYGCSIHVSPKDRFAHEGPVKLLYC